MGQLDVATTLPDRARSSLQRAAENLARRQGPDGAWAGDYGGPMFLLPMYLALCHVAGRVPQGKRREGMIRYFFNAQRTDGSIGLHQEEERGSMFTTALSYVGLRVLGVAASDERLSRMRRWIHSNGTPLGAASWGKLTLCLLGLYDWEGIHPIPVELWLLPAASPIHPGKLWCHCRQVYLPMSWLYARRAIGPADSLVQSLREELYPQGWARIDWRSHRDDLASSDSYRGDSWPLRALNRALGLWEKVPSAPLRRRAMDIAFEHILYEDEVTGFIDIGPVNKVLNAFVHYFRDPRGTHFERAFAACDLYLWEGHDGIKMQGYNSSKLWDTAFALQAVLASPAARDHAPMIESAYGYLRDNQILEDVPDAERHFRHASRGGWPFSNRAHGWPITDCTAEGLKCALALEGRFQPSIPKSLLKDSVRLILSWQNEDGGWATYERMRGGPWWESLNPSQVFGDIMVDYSYVECTSACVQALVVARRELVPYLREIDQAVERGVAFLRAAQRADGSFEGSWGVCFTYGTWFGVSGLMAAGAAPHDPAVLRACQFLLSKQKPDGGWGEHGDSCRERRYIEARQSGVAQTSWALSALARARHASAEAQGRAVELLLSKQRDDGAWPREPLVGVFNRTCLINYDNYRHYFPLWAVSEWLAAQARG